MSSSRWDRIVAGVTPVDVALAIVLMAIGLTDALSQDEYSGGRERLVLAVLLQTAPLLWRRQRTLLAASLSALGVVVEVAGHEPYSGVYGLVGFLLLAHATARWTEGSQQRYAVGALAAGIVAHTLSSSSGAGEGPLAGAASVVMPLLLGGVAWWIGRLGRAAADREDRLVATAAATAAQWEARNREVIEAERARISRELHDVVGHALAGISLTAGAAELQPGGRDPQMASALELIRTMSRDAASDVRRLVELLRTESDEGDATQPQPTLEELPALVERANSAGMRVQLDEHGTPMVVPAGLQLTAYRVVQEGLTNVARHAAGADVDVILTWQPGQLAVEVENGAPATQPAAGDGGGGGHGLAGLRERVRLFDGTVDAGPTSRGGFCLSARFPLS